MPYSKSNSLPVSTNEWTASLAIDELPVHSAAPALVIATSTLPTNAAYTAVFDDDSAAISSSFARLHRGRFKQVQLAQHAAVRGVSQLFVDVQPIQFVAFGTKCFEAQAALQVKRAARGVRVRRDRLA